MTRPAKRKAPRVVWINVWPDGYLGQPYRTKRHCGRGLTEPVPTRYVLSPLPSHPKKRRGRS